MPVTLRNTDVLFNDGSTQSAAFNSGTSAVQWGNVASRPTALSQFTNNLGNYGGFIDTCQDAVELNANCGGNLNCSFSLARGGNTIAIRHTNCACVCDCG